MNSKNYILPHMGHAVDFPRPHPLLAVVVENYVSPLSLHVDASSIQRSLFEDLVVVLQFFQGLFYGLQRKL